MECQTFDIGLCRVSSESPTMGQTLAVLFGGWGGTLVVYGTRPLCQATFVMPWAAT